jgi:deoxyhypusine synthase
MRGKEKFLNERIEHIDIKSLDSRALIDAFSKMAFQARNTARAARIYDAMLADGDCSIVLCLAGSLFSAGLRKAVYDMVECNMVDAIVSTGAIVVDQDFFEALGFGHYAGTPRADDDALQRQHIGRIYDTYIDEDELRECDMTVARIADSLEPKPYSSREFIREMGAYLDTNAKQRESVVLAAYNRELPVFVPAFSDCSAGFGFVHHQWHGGRVSIDSAKDFLELTRIKLAAKQTGLFMVGGGVPKNFAQDAVVAAEVLGKSVPMHKYAVQITVADERDGGLSGSTLSEAHSWGKVDTGNEQMVFAEATLALPLIASYAYAQGNWKKRKPKRYSKMLDSA